MSRQVTEAPKGGRPRSDALHQAILKAALDLVLEVGFRGVSIEGIAARTGVGKTTIYRRWPNKAAVSWRRSSASSTVCRSFPEHERAVERLRLQMQTTAKAFRGRVGALVKALMAESQFDADLAQAFRENWTLPRRKLVLRHFDQGDRAGRRAAGHRPGSGHRSLLRADLLPLATGNGPDFRGVCRLHLMSRPWRGSDLGRGSTRRNRPAPRSVRLPSPLPVGAASEFPLYLYRYNGSVRKRLSQPACAT